MAYRIYFRGGPLDSETHGGSLKLYKDHDPRDAVYWVIRDSDPIDGLLTGTETPPTLDEDQRIVGSYHYEASEEAHVWRPWADPSAA